MRSIDGMLEDNALLAFSSDLAGALDVNLAQQPVFGVSGHGYSDAAQPAGCIVKTIWI
jgi:hypothetical protein